MSSSDQSESHVQPSKDLPKNKTQQKNKQPITENTKDLMEKPETKKLSTKEMIIVTLSESRSRKGISLYAIKKSMQEKYNVDTEKINYLIKKNIKESVEAGTIIQTKGVGASGSFRLAPGSKQPKKPLKEPKKTLKVPKKPKEATEKDDKLEKPKKSSSKNVEEDSKPKKKVAKAINEKNDSEKPKKTKTLRIMESPKPGTSSMKTPKKKSSKMMKRKSIGSIIKPPRMKPVKAK